MGERTCFKDGMRLAQSGRYSNRPGYVWFGQAKRFGVASRQSPPNNQRMDQFTAHLDRGWDLAQRGDAAGAEASARRALELEGDSPEAHNLLGFSCALRGEHDEALDYYVQAIALDDTFLEAVLNAAEICVFPI